MVRLCVSVFLRSTSGFGATRSRLWISLWPNAASFSAIFLPQSLLKLLKRPTKAQPLPGIRLSPKQRTNFFCLPYLAKCALIRRLRTSKKTARVHVYACFHIASEIIDLSGSAKSYLVGVLPGRFREDPLAGSSTVTADSAGARDQCALRVARYAPRVKHFIQKCFLTCGRRFYSFGSYWSLGNTPKLRNRGICCILTNNWKVHISMCSHCKIRWLQ